ncbi:MAG: flagellar hook-basal body complex protein [Planktotalea sp.]|uniref:flagellar hook-basal body complex protein n=1 Tax=Planktotalea sp. TaxID=2029877 RepID=UPI0026376658|nr:flagellar hook-basal body complex protein [Planktotalea sp.]MDG1075067.1 flagellar hook-basal body complex protein [Planktotalea sp.]MDG1085567.1 flagellar hook-basal body complex protein [Planktotalea sp.]
MSFYTALTGLNDAQSDISTSSNNIANVGTTGFKRSRAEFGDIFATSPLQNSSSSIGSGAILKGVKQQFTQGNIASSLNALDMAISGQGFFALKPSQTSTQVVYTRNGSFNVDNNRNVVDSSGQFLLTYPVNEDGSVTAKDIDSATPLRLPVTSGDPQATTNVDLSVNLPANAEVAMEKDKFRDGYTFDPDDPESFTNSTSFTIFDDLGNPTIATVYYIKTQAASAEDPTNKFETRLVINDEVVSPDLVPALNDNGNQIYIDQFGNQTTTVPDPSYFDAGRSAPLYKLDELRTRLPSQPAILTGEQSGFDFGDEGSREIEIVTDPMLFGATYEADAANQGVYWGNDFLLVNLDDGTRPVSISIRPGNYNAEELASEVERAINESYDDARKVEVRKGGEDTINIQLFTPSTDGDVPVANSVSIDLLEPSFVSTQAGIDVANLTSPNFELDTFLAHAQARINDTLNDQLGQNQSAVPNIASNQFAKITTTEKLADPPEMPQSFGFEYTTRDLDVSSLANGSDRWDIDYFEGEFTVSSIQNAPTESGKSVSFSVKDRDVFVAIPDGATSETEVLDAIKSKVEKLFSVSSTAPEISVANGELTVSGATANAPTTLSLEAFGAVLSVDVEATDTDTSIALKIKEKIDATGVRNVAVEQNGSVLSITGPTIESESGASSLSFAVSEQRYMAYTNFGNRPDVKVYDRQSEVATSGQSPAIEYDAEADRLSITMKSVAGLSVGDNIVLMGADNVASAINGRTYRITSLDGNTIQIATGDLGLPDDNIAIDVDVDNPFIVLSEASSDVEAFFEGADLQVDGSAQSFNSQRIVLRERESARHSYTDVNVNGSNKSIFGAFEAQLGVEASPTASDFGLSNSAIELEWVDERNPPIKIKYDAATQSIVFNIDHTALGPGGTISDVSAVQMLSGNSENLPSMSAGALSNSSKVTITASTNVSGSPFILDGGLVSSSPDRFGAKVSYDRDSHSFTFESGTTGKAVRANKAMGVETDQKASNIQVGRYEIDASTGLAITGDGTIDLASRVLADGKSHLMGVGSTVSVGFLEGTGLKSEPAKAIGGPAKDPLNSQPVFLNPANFETTFNVSVNGVNANIEIPGGNYIGTTLAELLEQRINQMRDPETGQTIGGVTVKYQPTENNFVFTTGTTGDTSTIRVKGPAKLGLDDVPLSVGSVPTIAKLVQATNENGIPLYVNENGDIVDTEPDNLVADYYPLYLDEGELTFDKTGKLISPQGMTRYESQSDSFSISLDIDFSSSTQLATPFAVNNLEQNGFTSGRLDGLNIDATGLLRANYTNGQNKPLGKIVLANFNNQNGLKQVGNATFVETATSGEPLIGEAGTEGFGSIQSGALERSNVDITEELVNLITAQRNFQASSKAIETSTQLTQTIINIRT